MNSNHLKKDEKYYPKVFLKECKYIERKVVTHIIDNLESSSDNSDDSNEEYVKDMKLMFLEKIIFENVFFEGAILKMYSGYLSSQ